MARPVNAGLVSFWRASALDVPNLLPELSLRAQRGNLVTTTDDSGENEIAASLCSSR